MIRGERNRCDISDNLFSPPPRRLQPDPERAFVPPFKISTPVVLPVWVFGAMKVPLWCLVVLLVCLFTPGRSDCQGQCAACGLLLQQQQKQQLQQAFNVMVSVRVPRGSRHDSLVIRASALSACLN